MADETLLNGGHHGRIQRRPVKVNGWTRKRRTAFLKALMETCNVKLSCKRAGMGHTSVYGVRHRDPAFATLWDEALAIGYDRLEALLLQRAIDGVNDIDVAALAEDGASDDRASDDGDAGDGATGEPSRGHRHPGSGIPRNLGRGDVQLALAMLNRRGDTKGLRAGKRKLMSSEDVDALLTKKLDALARRRAKA